MSEVVVDDKNVCILEFSLLWLEFIKKGKVCMQAVNL